MVDMNDVFLMSPMWKDPLAQGSNTERLQKRKHADADSQGAEQRRPTQHHDPSLRPKYGVDGRPQLGHRTAAGHRDHADTIRNPR